MLVQVALIVFALSAMLSLVIDIGYLRITQGQMQSAADSGALEGLRNLNASNSAFQSDCYRRAAATRMVQRTFDDNFDATDGDPDQYGAGPILDLTDGSTSLHALQTASVPDAHSYKPDLQMNRPNQVDGDMVSGRFCYSPDPVRSEDVSYEGQDIVCTEPQNGSGSYARNDFNPNPTAPQPPPTLGECLTPDDALTSPPPVPGAGTPADVASNGAFLVRLRRSNEFQDLAGQTETGIATSGPTLPLTFGKATTIYGDDPSGGYSVRRDGLTVRATAIAAVRPALRVGTPRLLSNPPLPGVTQFALVDTCVQAAAGAPPNAAVSINVTINPANGVITRRLGPGPPTCPIGAPVGRFVTDAAMINTVGQAPPPAPPPLPAVVRFPCMLTPSNLAGQFGPVYSLMASGATRIIGFTRVNFARPACQGPVGAPFNATITVVRGVSLVAASNATAAVAGGLPLPVEAEPADVRELLDKNLVRVGRIDYAPVLVAVLAR